MITPNKQNLLASKKQLKTLENGHKLLEEKRNGLIVSFIDLCRRGKELEREVGSGLDTILSKYNQSLAFVSTDELVSKLDRVAATNLSVKKKRVSGVAIKELSIDVKNPERTGIKSDIKDSLSSMGGYMPKLIELIQLKNTCDKIAKEILKTNRQISAIDGKIENTKGNIKWIKQVLEEKSNLEKSVLINIFG